jgi:hypothetical protein
MGSLCLLDHVGSNLIVFGALWLELELAQAGDHGVRPSLSHSHCRVKEEVVVTVRTRTDGHD